MPFKSKAQQRYMFARHPEIAKEFAHKTPDMKNLPEKIHPEVVARRLKRTGSSKTRRG